MGTVDHGKPIQQLPGGRRAVLLDSWFCKLAGRGGTGRKHQEHIEVYSRLTFADDYEEQFTVRLWPHDGDHLLITQAHQWDYWQGQNKRMTFDTPLLVVVRADDNGVWRLSDVMPDGANFRDWLTVYNPSEDLLDWLTEQEPEESELDKHFGKRKSS
jgi:hypothetical protein